MSDEAKRWLCIVYNCRGQLGPALWPAFAEFCESEGFICEPNPGADILAWVKQA